MLLCLNLQCCCVLQIHSGWYLGGSLFAVSGEGAHLTDGQIAIGVIYILMGFAWLAGAIPAVILIIVVSYTLHIINWDTDY